MAQEYKITAVGNKETWQSSYGPMISYELKLDVTGEEIVKQNKKPNSPAPKVGDAIYGTVERNAFGAKFKTEQRAGAPVPTSAKPAWQPKDERQITRNMVWKNLLGHYDVQNLEYGSDQWQHFWAGVDLHTDMLLPKEDKPVTEPPKAAIHAKLEQGFGNSNEEYGDEPYPEG